MAPWTLLHRRPWLTHWPFYFCHLTHFVIWPFFDLRPFNQRGHRGHLCMFAQHQHIDPLTFVIWHILQFDFSDLWPLIRRSDKEVTMDTFASSSNRPRLTHWPFYFCHLTHFVIWPFFDLWPLNRRSDEEVTVDIYACLPNTNTTNTLTLLLLSFDTFFYLTFRWRLTP